MIEIDEEKHNKVKEAEASIEVRTNNNNDDGTLLRTGDVAYEMTVSKNVGMMIIAISKDKLELILRDFYCIVKNTRDFSHGMN